MNPSNMDKEQLAKQLNQAAWELGHRGLVRAARWAAEGAAAVALPHTYEPHPPPTLAPRTLQAKLYFDGHEYDRCWHVLKDPPDAAGLFLRLFSRYHSGEKLKEEAQGSEFFAKPDSGKPPPLNPYLVEILRELEDVTPELSDGFMLYLKGVVLRAQKRDDDAREALVASVLAYPWNWSAWMELLLVLGGLAAVDSVVYQVGGIMAHIFRVYAYQELYQPMDTLARDFSDLEAVFSAFSFLDVQKALVWFHDLEHARGFELFEQVLKREPYRLEDLDQFSNELYVTENRAKLAFLAQLAATTDKHRAESCCVIANYYSLVGKHEMALSYYQRALILNRNYMPAWTLMGHEFIELQNTHAAIESYRTAVDITPQDFRAWYGLGQAYEILGMYSYAQYYYQRTVSLRPSDVRVWQALANVFELQRRGPEASQAYRQALRLLGTDAFISYRLGALSADSGDDDQAAKFMLAAVEAGSNDAEDAGDAAVEAVARARLWLAQRAANSGDRSRAREYAEAVLEQPPGTQAGAVLVEEARKLLF